MFNVAALLSYCLLGRSPVNKISNLVVNFFHSELQMKNFLKVKEESPPKYFENGIVNTWTRSESFCLESWNKILALVLEADAIIFTSETYICRI